MEKAKALYQATKHLRFANIPPIDLQDRLALATVAAGLRPVGVLEGDDLQLERNREQIISCGLHTLISKSVWCRTEWPRNHPLLRVLQLLEESRKHSTSQRVLWFCANAGDRKALKAASLTKQQAGLLLGYPECCVEFECGIDLKANTEYLTALIAKVGNDEQSVARALRDNVGVDVSSDVFTLKNVPRTDAQFPFVIHVACDSCLASPDSPTARRGFVPKRKVNGPSSSLETSENNLVPSKLKHPGQFGFPRWPPPCPAADHHERLRF